MNPLCTSLDTLSVKPPPLSLNPTLHLRSTNSLHFSRSSFLSNPGNLKFKQTLVAKTPPKSLGAFRSAPVGASAAADIDMVKNKQGIYTPKQKKVVVLWDLDNKPPRGPPYQAATALRRVSQNFGEVVEMSAYANRHAFIHLPQWVVEERRERKQLDILERKGMVTPAEPYVCGVCGRKCKTNLDLKRHFKQLHERERQKKLNRMRSLKGKKKQKYREKYVAGNHKYNEAARVLIKPKVGYGLALELRRAGVFVKTVEDKPQAADWALKRQMQHSMSRRIDWLVLVSDDSDFSEMLRKAREANLGTVVVGDWDRALGRHADLWVPWNGVENGEVTEKDLVPNRRGEREDADREDSFFSLSVFDEDVDGDSDLDNVVNELVAGRSEIGSVRISAFSEGEEEEEEEEDEEWDADEVPNGFMLGYSEDEEDVYF